MDAGIFFTTSAAFVASSAAAAFALTRSGSRWAPVGLAAVALGGWMAYSGLDRFVGSPKPVDVFPGWSHPDLGGRGATVLGGSFNKEWICLLLQEDGGHEPRLYAFANRTIFRMALLNAMQKHADESAGEHWGFTIKPGSSSDPKKPKGASPDGEGSSSGVGDPPFVVEEDHPVEPPKVPPT